MLFLCPSSYADFLLADTKFQRAIVLFQAQPTQLYPPSNAEAELHLRYSLANRAGVYGESNELVAGVGIYGSSTPRDVKVVLSR
jgi:hypothetical protein